MKIVKCFIFISLLCLTGCITQHKIQVNTTKQWEGHYFNTNDFYKATSNITLEDKESIWVLSNRTLNTVLKNVEK